MANRQQRRHPPKDNNAPEQLVPMMLQRLKEPEVVADLSVAELKEITARNEEFDFVSAQAEHFARLRTLLGSEKALFIRGLCTSKGLSPQEEFNCDLERGVILRTAVQVPVQVEAIEVPPPEPTDVPLAEEPQAEQPS